jgi:hypothetical protein
VEGLGADPTTSPRHTAMNRYAPKRHMKDKKEREESEKKKKIPCEGNMAQGGSSYINI